MTADVIRASKATAKRYERARPGELVHMDVKKIWRIPDGGGWRGRAMGSTGARKRARIGYDFVHSVVDDYTRMAYSEILPDEKGATCAAFLTRAAAALICCRCPKDRTGHHRQPLVLPPLTRRRRGHRGPGRNSQVHQAALPVAERQGRAVQPHAGHRMGIPADLHLQRRTSRRPCALARLLQHSTTPHRSQRTPTDQPPVTNVMAGYI